MDCQVRELLLGEGALRHFAVGTRSLSSSNQWGPGVDLLELSVVDGWGVKVFVELLGHLHLPVVKMPKASRTHQTEDLGFLVGHGLQIGRAWLSLFVRPRCLQW